MVQARIKAITATTGAFFGSIKGSRKLYFAEDFRLPILNPQSSSSIHSDLKKLEGMKISVFHETGKRYQPNSGLVSLTRFGATKEKEKVKR